MSVLNKANRLFLFLFLTISFIALGFLYLSKDINTKEEYLNIALPIEDIKININHCDKASLKTLPGIGDVLAGRIIAYREAFGPFKDIEDLKNIKGIKSSRFDIIKDRVLVDEK